MTETLSFHESRTQVVGRGARRATLTPFRTRMTALVSDLDLARASPPRRELTRDASDRKQRLDDGCEA